MAPHQVCAAVGHRTHAVAEDRPEDAGAARRSSTESLRVTLSGFWSACFVRHSPVLEGGRGEPPGLGIPNVVDRVIQQAVLQILEPIFEPTLKFNPRIAPQSARRPTKIFRNLFSSSARQVRQHRWRHVG
jgi:hypothetical protein